jgi:hypothetical protein
MSARSALKARRKPALKLVSPQPNNPDQPQQLAPQQSPPQAPDQASHQIPHLVTARDADRPPLSIVATPSAEPISAEAIVAKAIAAEPIAIAPASIEPAKIGSGAIAPAVDPFPDAPAGDHLISWGALGCPRESGAYIATGLDGVESNAKISVKLIHIFAAENDPSALFTVVVLRPPLGPPVFSLGHRVA